MPPEFPTKFTLEDYLFTPLCVILILATVFMIRRRQGIGNTNYKYFLPGLAIKLFASISMCYVYLYFYVGGDTLNYYFSSRVMLELLKVDAPSFFKIVFLGDLSPETISIFTVQTGRPLYLSDPFSFFIVRLTIPFSFISMGSLVVTSLLFTCFSYSGIWKLYLVFIEEFPTMKKELAIAVLFIPSVFFWGSGILKDPITFSSVGWFIYAFYKIFFKKKTKPIYFIQLAVSSFLMLSIKPYIFYILFPSISIWLLMSLLGKIKTGFIKIISFPIMLGIFTLSTYILLAELGKEKSKFSIDQIFNFALVTQKDLQNEEYGGSSFDIGSFDANIGSMITKAPLAINYALFRPYIWEAKNMLMVFSALENMVILLLTIYFLIRIKFRKIRRTMSQHPIIFFSFSYAIVFAFSVGISTSNFGALVRYKIPFIPFYIASIFILLKEHEKKNTELLPEAKEK